MVPPYGTQDTHCCMKTGQLVQGSSSRKYVHKTKPQGRGGSGMPLILFILFFSPSFSSSFFFFFLFCFVLFCFVLFCFCLFCFVLFCFVLFCFVLFHFFFFFFLNTSKQTGHKNESAKLVPLCFATMISVLVMSFARLRLL
jgi:hypothetical protein